MTTTNTLATHRTGRSTLLAGLLSIGLMGSLAGCYSSWPPIDANPNFDVNATQDRGAMVAAAKWALARYNASGAKVALNLPRGLRRSSIIEISERAGTDVLTPESAASLSVWHIPRVWIRNDNAEVDVMFPMTGLPDGRQHKMVTLRLKGGISNWNVKVSREWESLLRPVPELHYLPAEEYPPTYGPEHEEPAAPLLEPVEATPAAPSEGMTGG